MIIYYPEMLNILPTRGPNSAYDENYPDIAGNTNK